MAVGGPGGVRGERCRTTILRAFTTASSSIVTTVETIETWAYAATILAVLSPIIAELGIFSAINKGRFLNYRSKEHRVRVLSEEASDLIRLREEIRNYEDIEPPVSTTREGIEKMARGELRKSEKFELLVFLTVRIENTMRRCYAIMSESRLDKILRFLPAIVSVIMLAWASFTLIHYGFSGPVDPWATIVTKIALILSVSVSLIVIAASIYQDRKSRMSMDQIVDVVTNKLSESESSTEDESGRRS